MNLNVQKTRLRLLRLCLTFSWKHYNRNPSDILIRGLFFSFSPRPTNKTREALDCIRPYYYDVQVQHARNKTRASKSQQQHQLPTTWRKKKISLKSVLEHYSNFWGTNFKRSIFRGIDPLVIDFFILRKKIFALPWKSHFLSGIKYCRAVREIIWGVGEKFCHS